MADGPFGSNLKTEHYISEKQVRVVQLSNIGMTATQNTHPSHTPLRCHAALFLQEAF